MKKVIITMLWLSSPVMAFAATDSCSDQITDLTAKTERAKNHGNKAEIARLNIALDKVKTYCTDERQTERARDNVRKQQMKLKQAKEDLQAARQELEEATAEGRSDNVAKESRKAEEKRLKLEAARNELKQAQDNADRLR